MRASAVEQMMSFAFDQGREFERLTRTVEAKAQRIGELERELAELRMDTAKPLTREVPAVRAF